MSTCAVTIAGPDRRVDLAVSTDTPIADLLPTFVDLTVDEAAGEDGRQPAWGVGPAGKNPLPSDRTLGDCGVTDGHVLVLSKLRPASQAPPKPAQARTAEVRHGTPRERTQRVLPYQLTIPARLSAASKAFFGHEDPTVPDETEAPGGGDDERRAALERPEERSALQRGRDSWHESDYVNRLDRRIAAPRLLRCATIAIVSPKGGVGKTTLTALLGSLLAQVRRDRAVAVDTNPDYGSLGRTLAPGHKVFVDDLLDVLDEPTLTVTQLDAKLGRARDGLMILPAPTDPERMARLDEAAYTKVIRRLQDLVGLLVLDCGTGLQEPAARAALSTADQVVVVSDAQPATATLVAEASDLLRRSSLPLTLVVNKMPAAKRARIDVDAFASAIHEINALIVVDVDDRAAARVAAGEFSWSEAPAEWRRAIGELATVLEADWPALGLSA